MARRFWLALILGMSWALAQENPEKKKPAPDVDEPPEEDESLAREKKVYDFDPLQAQKEIKIGLYYLKKKSFRAAAGRFAEASQWDPTSADALFYLGEARERAGNHKAKREAWEKFLALAPEDKRAGDVKKKLGS